MVRWTSPNIQFEELVTGALCSPQLVVCCHLLDQADRLGRESRLSRMRLGYVVPEHAEELTMEAAAASLAGQGKGPLSRVEPSWRGAPEEAGPSFDTQGV
jgi:hypothetical protein